MLARVCLFLRLLYGSSLYQQVIRRSRPLASHVLACHLRQRNLPSWTSFCVYKHRVINDQFGLSHFNWSIDGVNYHILRTGCWPFIKYHCTQRPHQDLSYEDNFYRWLKLVNFGVPTLVYGIGSWFLARVVEQVQTDKGPVSVFFLNKEDHDAQY